MPHPRPTIHRRPVPRAARVALAPPAARAALVALALLAACSGSRGVARDVPAATSAADDGTLAAAHAVDASVPALPSCRGGAAPYDEAALRARVTWLASPELAGRVPGSTGDAAARAHVAARFACLGLAGGGDGGAYEQPFTDASGRATANVIAVLPGRDERLAREIIVVGAHHDHLGGGHLGANDNASGVAALLAIAQELAERAEAPRRTVVLVAFGAEEASLGGSTHYVTHAPAAYPMERVVYMIDLDMVGSYGSKNVVYALGAFRGTPARTLLDARRDAHPDLKVTPGAAGRGSDHQPFCDLGIPYLFFWTPDASCYHGTCDTADRVAYPPMAQIAALAGELVVGLADGEADLAAWRAAKGCRP